MATNALDVNGTLTNFTSNPALFVVAAGTQTFNYTSTSYTDAAGNLFYTAKGVQIIVIKYKK